MLHNLNFRDRRRQRGQHPTDTDRRQDHHLLDIFHHHHQDHHQGSIKPTTREPQRCPHISLFGRIPVRNNQALGILDLNALALRPERQDQSVPNTQLRILRPLRISVARCPRQR